MGERNTTGGTSAIAAVGIRPNLIRDVATTGYSAKALKFSSSPRKGSFSNVRDFPVPKRR
jgi:hypothetical protein